MGLRFWKVPRALYLYHPQHGLGHSGAFHTNRQFEYSYRFLRGIYQRDFEGPLSVPDSSKEKAVPVSTSGLEPPVRQQTCYCLQVLGLIASSYFGLHFLPRRRLCFGRFLVERSIWTCLRQLRRYCVSLPRFVLYASTLAVQWSITMWRALMMYDELTTFQLVWAIVALVCVRSWLFPQ